MRTEQEIIKDFEQLGYKGSIHNDITYLVKNYEFDKDFTNENTKIVCRIANQEQIVIDKENHTIEKMVHKVLNPDKLSISVSTSSEITLLEFKILHELFESLGWL